MDGGGVKLTIGDKTIELTVESKAKLNDKNYKSEEGDVLIQDGVTYISSSLLCAMLEYSDAGEGNVCMIGSLSFANADSQLVYMTALGQNLPDRRPDIPKADHYMALTFDDGPTGGSSGLTARLLNGLQERGRMRPSLCAATASRISIPIWIGIWPKDMNSPTIPWIILAC